MAKDISRYMNTVKRQLKRCGDYDGEYYAIFAQEVDTYCADHPSVTLAEIKAKFGRPAAQVSEFLRTLPNEEIKEKLTSRRRFFTFAKIVLAVLAAAIIILMTIFVVDTWSFNHGNGIYSPVQEGLSERDSSAIAIY